MTDEPTQRVPHFFTVDVEEWFQVAAFDRYVAPETWPGLESRVERSTDELLELLDRHGVRGTFFTLGWVAKRAPDLVRRIVKAGHELGSHGWLHRRVTGLDREAFREEARRSKALLEQAAGVAVLGYRAPNFSIVPDVEWAFDVLLEEGYRYDSSLFPIPRRGYGYPSSPRVPYRISRLDGELLEVPISVGMFLGVLPMPIAGGGYFRTFPYAWARWNFRHFARRGQHACFYVHPWEIDPDQPRIAVDPITRRRHYGGLGHTLERMDRLLSEFRFTSIADVFFPGEGADVDHLDLVALNR